MVRSFFEFVEDKKNDKKTKSVASKASLGDGNDYKPFVISDDPNSEHYGSNASLAPIVRAFKKGANWGWSKDDKTGEDKPVKISSKKLFLTGGAVRDHLAGKTPRNIELTTNASPDEIYNILKQNDFEFTGNDSSDCRQCFWVMEKDINNRPYKFGIRVKNDEYELSVFSANPKGVDGQEFKSGTQEEDAASRDFTINALSLGLTNDNGPNKELNDFFGGLHHLQSGEIIPIGDIEEKLKEDPTRALRYARMLSRYGKPETASEKDKSAISKIVPQLSQIDRKKVSDEFSKMFYDDGNSRNALKIYGDLGLLDGIFPNSNLNKEFPKELSEIGDKHMPLAWLFKNQTPDDVEFNMTGFDPNIVKKIVFLLKSLNIGESIDPTTLSDLRSNYMESGISTRTLRNWATKVAKKDDRIVDAFIQHVKSPRIKVFISEDNNQVSDDFKDLVDPFTGSVNPHLVEDRKKDLEYRNFSAILKKHMPLTK